MFFVIENIMCTLKIPKAKTVAFGRVKIFENFLFTMRLSIEIDIVRIWVIHKFSDFIQKEKLDYIQIAIFRIHRGCTLNQK